MRTIVRYSAKGACLEAEVVVVKSISIPAQACAKREIVTIVTIWVCAD
ncbi:hypothetical protein [Variovorax sp. OV329]|nr:hypothetical protein [Variovorax sp. OV329]